MGRPSKQLQILQAARRLFSEFGYQGTSIDLVVQHAGVSKPTVYNHFTTKQEMLQQLLLQLAEEAKVYRSTLHAQHRQGDINGLCASFRHVTDTPAHLASYRMLAGERFKLSVQIVDEIRRLETEHQNWCDVWLADVTDAKTARLLVAICRNELVYPALMGSELLSDQVLQKRLREHL